MKVEEAIVFDMNDCRIDDDSECSRRSEQYLSGCENNFYNEMDEGCCVLAESLDLPPIPIRRVKSTSNLLQIPTVSRSRKSSDDSAVGSAEDSDLSDKSDNNLSASSSTETQDMLCASSRPSRNNRQPASSTFQEILAPSTFPVPVLATAAAAPTATTVPVPTFSNVDIPIAEPPLTATPSKSKNLPPPSVVQPVLPLATLDVSTARSATPDRSSRPRISSKNSSPPPTHSRQLSAPPLPVGPVSSHLVVARSCSDDTELLSEASGGGGGGGGYASAKCLDYLRPPSVVVSDHDLSPSVDRYITLDDLDAEFSLSQSRRRLSDCSTCSTLSLNEPEYYISTLPSDEPEEEAVKKVSAWRRIRTIVHQVTPFIQTYKKNKYLWVQLAGHQGSFKQGDKAGTIKKKYCEREKESLELLMQDALRPFVPHYYGCDSDDYLELEDLLARFHNPCVMDCKIGVRTYLEEELIKAKEKPKLRKDMYEKMCQIDPLAPTPEEHQLRGVTKPRYMVWRETISATSTLGFRIEGIRHSDGKSTKDFKTTKLESEVKTAFKSFVSGTGNKQVVRQFLERLYQLRDTLSKSNFFATHEVIGSSLLFVHDEKDAGIWMIDFAKTIPLPPHVGPLRHDIPWTVGNHEDGYLVGIKHLIKIYEELRDD